MQLVFNPDSRAQSLFDDFDHGKIPKQLAFINGTNNNYPAKLNIEFESQSDILSGQFGLSILCKFFNEDDQQFFENIEDIASKSLPKDITFNSLLKEDKKLFIKLQVRNNEFTAKFDPPFNVDQLHKSNIHAGSLLDIELQPNIWINFEQRTAGLFLKIFKVTINGGKRKILKRR